MDDFKEKTDMIAAIFQDPTIEDAPKNAPVKHEKFYGGVYNGRKFMYSDFMIQSLPIEKLESFIKKQIAYDQD